MRTVVVVCGPTAAGKSKFAIDIARERDGEIINADSMQIYDELQVGTARPTFEQMQGVPHHLFGFLPPTANCSVALYQAEAFRVIDEICDRGKLPIICGGTGLYINSLTYRLNFPNEDLTQREMLTSQYEVLGAEQLHKMLCELDPKAAGRIHKNDKKRLIRRLTIIASGDNSFDFRTPNTDYDFEIIGVTKPREMLYRDIERRVEAMFEAGLETEVRTIFEKYGADIQAFSAIGYKEFLPYFAGEASVKEVQEIIARNTRRYAKRQMTWFARDNRIVWHNKNNDNNSR